MLFAAIVAHAEAVKDREGAVRADKAKMENDARWIYEDVERGFAEARRTGKPLLVVLRCVPCKSCMGMDAAVLSDEALGRVLDEFVCVRLINANSLDLNLFEMETDLSLSAMAFNADRTIYARFGSWQHQRDPLLSDLRGFTATLEKVLEAHKGYPGNAAFLKGKQPEPGPFRSPVEIPALAEKYKTVLDWEGKVVGSCIHCHMIGDAHRTWYRSLKQPVPDEWIFPYPGPETLGLTLGEDGVSVTRVEAQSPAAAAGLVPGDELIKAAGQALFSVADLAWVLHKTANVAGTLVLESQKGAHTVQLPAAWKEQASAAQRVGVWSMRGMALGGLVLVDLTDEERRERGLPSTGMALLVKGVGQYGMHGTAKKVGFQKDDLVVGLDGMDSRLSEAKVLAHLLRNRMPGERVAVNLRRGERSLTLELPMQ